jgi:hypothetical protein
MRTTEPDLIPGHAPRTKATRRKRRRDPTEPPRTGKRARSDAAAEKRLQKRANVEQWRLPPATHEETIFRHGHWQPRRLRVRAALTRCGANVFQLERFDACGGECTIEWSEELQKHRVRANYCKSRHCEPCARAKANLIARNLRDALENAPKNHHRFVTLTLKHSDAPLHDQVRRLYRCFKKLRDSEWWKKTQDGGAFMLEVKHNGTHWHPHLHIISAGRFMRKEDLSGAWLRATGDSMIVDIRAIDSAKDVVHYVCKYVTKGTSPQVWQRDELADQFVIGTKRVRACGTYGTWRRFRLLAAPVTATDWKVVDSLTNIWRAARREEHWALAVIQSIGGRDAPPELE